MLRGIVMEDCTITYVPDDRVGWVISKSKCNYFSDTGEIEKSFSYTVQRASINESLDEDLFALEFPVGTHIERIEGEDRGYYIQEIDGKMRQISFKEYGVIPANILTEKGGGSWVPVAITVVVVLVLAISIFRKRYKMA